MNATMSSHELAVHKAIYRSHKHLAKNPKNHATDCMLYLVIWKQSSIYHHWHWYMTLAAAFSAAAI